MNSVLRTLGVIAITWALMPLAIAQDDDQGNIAFHYVATPKEGKVEEFHDALKEHMEWRAKNGETWSWHAYDVVAGWNINEIHYRSWGHSWADMDAYENSEFSEQAQKHYDKTVLPYISKERVFIDKDDMDLTAWPEDGGNFSLVRLIGYKLKPGKVQQWYKAAKAIHAALQDGGFAEPYGFTWTVAGGADPYVTLVLPSENWAGFEDPDPSAYKVVSDQLGEEAASELFAHYSSAIYSSKTWIVAHNKELSLDLGN